MRSGNVKNTKNAKNTKNLPLICAAAVLVCAVAAVLLFRGKDEENIAQGSGVGVREVQVIETGESLVIPLDEVTENAQFYPVSVDGTKMEVLAVRDSSGEVRTAFNTCQSCYSSGYGYYVQEGNELVCQNCGNRFTMDQVEVAASGCNPYPIFEENKTTTENTLQISYDFLKDSKELFATWKI